MRRYFIIFSLALFCAGCQSSQSPSEPGLSDTIVTETSEDTLANKQEEAIAPSDFDSFEGRVTEKTKQMNIGYVRLWDGIWKRRNAPIVLSEDTSWLLVTRDRLAAAYDSVFPGTHDMPVADKADIMSDTLFAFLYDEGACTTYEMGLSQSIKDAFLRYQMVASYYDIMKLGNLYVSEVQCWEEFQKHLSEFMSLGADITYYGGTMCSLVASSKATSLSELRLASNKDILSDMGQSKEFDNSVDKAVQKFIITIDSEYGAYESNQYDAQGQRDALEKMGEEKLLTLQALSKWIDSRKAFENEEMSKNTVALLSGITQIFIDSETSL